MGTQEFVYVSRFSIASDHNCTIFFGKPLIFSSLTTDSILLQK